MFIKILLQHSQTLTLGSICCPPSQISFTELVTKHFSKINTNNTEIYILGDFEINLFLTQKHIFHQINAQSMSHKGKKYFQFSYLSDLEQLKNSPTRLTCSTSFLIDHILATFPDKVP